MDLSAPIAAAVPGVHGRVLAVVARSGLPLTGKRVAELAGASIEQTRHVLRRMVDDGLLQSSHAGQAVLFEPNRTHLLWPAVQQLVHEADQAVWTLSRRISVTIEETLELDEAHGVTGALFGSVARGDSGPDSDVDVLLITPDDLPEPAVETLVVEVIRTVEAATGNDGNVLQLSRQQFDDLARTHDPMVTSLMADATVFFGPDLRRRARGEPWDGPGMPRPRTSSSAPRPRESTSR
mgnify:CR=1 FL=1